MHKMLYLLMSLSISSALWSMQRLELKPEYETMMRDNINNVLPFGHQIDNQEGNNGLTLVQKMHDDLQTVPTGHVTKSESFQQSTLLATQIYHQIMQNPLCAEALQHHHNQKNQESGYSFFKQSAQQAARLLENISSLRFPELKPYYHQLSQEEKRKEFYRLNRGCHIADINYFKAGMIVLFFLKQQTA